MTYRDIFENEVAVNAAGPGNVAGIGVGSDGEPGIDNKKKRSRTLLRGVIGGEKLGGKS